ncbi:MAG: hypothetical protein WAM24_13665, partial [Ignavibacteriaceae bacterium]
MMYLATKKINKFLIIAAICSIIISLQINAQTDTIQTNVPHLKNVFKNDFYIGCLLSYTYVGFPT